MGDEIDNDNDSNDDDDETLGENEVEELMTLVNAADDASPSSVDRIIRNIPHHRFRRVNRLKDAQIARMEEICASHS